MRMMGGMIFGLALIASGACADAQDLAGARQVFDGKMLPRMEVATFAHSETLFPVKVVERKGPVRPLPAVWLDC